MFTGIVQEVGKILNITKNGDNNIVEIKAGQILKSIKIGESINVEGICSTLTDLTKDSFKVSYMPETLKRTTSNDWKQNDNVNLEAALSINDKINGHFVLGHIDDTGKILKISKGKECLEIDIEFPIELSKYIAFKGSVTIDGVSLTISYLDENYFTVSLIPHTIKNTTLGAKKKNDKVNIEVDMISRYLQRLFDERDKQSSYEFLHERGFI